MVEITTFASPIDVGAWVRHHGLSPLAGDDPAHHVKALCGIKQTHFWGADDDIVPAFLNKPFIDKLSTCGRARTYIIPKMKHSGDWGSVWTQFQINQADYPR